MGVLVAFRERTDLLPFHENFSCTVRLRDDLYIHGWQSTEVYHRLLVSALAQDLIPEELESEWSFKIWRKQRNPSRELKIQYRCNRSLPAEILREDNIMDVNLHPWCLKSYEIDDIPRYLNLCILHGLVHWAGHFHKSNDLRANREETRRWDTVFDSL